MKTDKIVDVNKTLFKVYITDIDWDCFKDELEGLPSDMLAVVPAFDENTLLEGELANFLSDKFGFCVDGFKVETIEEVTDKDEEVGVIEFTPW